MLLIISKQRERLGTRYKQTNPKKRQDKQKQVSMRQNVPEEQLEIIFFTFNN
jgi:hypothetical protein